jgi:hypothetical protein
MNARSWFVLTAVCTLVCTSGCGSARWGSRHSRLRMPSGCVESSCDDPTCEICSPLPPLYDGMARNHRLNRRANRGHGRHGHGGCSCGSCGCGGGEWFDGEIIEGEIIGGDCYGGCSSCMSCGDGMVMDGGMPAEMMSSGGCQNCQHQAMSGSQMMMSSPSHEMHYEQQPTPAAPHSAPPASSPPPANSSLPGEMAPGAPMGQPMGSKPMTSMRAPNYGAALFTPPPVEPQPYVPAPSSTPIMYEQASPMPEPMPAPPVPPLASPVSHAAPMYLAPPPTSTAMPALPAPMMTTEAQPPEVYVPNNIPIQTQSAAMPATQSGKKPMRPFSEGAKPRRPAAQPQWEASLQMQTIQPAGSQLPALP